MVVVSPGPVPLDTSVVSCWHASDALLGNQPVVAFIGPAVNANVTQNSSWIQAHVFSIAGFRSYTRLTVNPTANIYEAVNRLPEDLQGDEQRRALAVSLYKYYLDIPKPIRATISKNWMGVPEGGLAPRIFDEGHAAALASKMTKVREAETVDQCIKATMAERTVSWVDLDLVLPSGSITVVPPKVPEGRASLVPLPDPRPIIDYGKYNTVLDLLGEATFLPTSRLRRAPSKPTAVSRTRVLDKAKEEGLHRELFELLSTEESYVNKLKSLVDSIAAREAISTQDRTLQRLFPPSLVDILSLNEEFLQRLKEVADEEPSNRDPTGAYRFSKLMLEYFPKFKGPYQDYLKVSSQFSKLITEMLRDPNSSYARAIRKTGEQHLRSWLIEPVQRLPRYTLLIDNMANLLPAEHPAMSRFLAARDMVTEICAVENDGPENNSRSIERLRRLVQGWSHSFEPSGRLVAAVDCNELEAPFGPDRYGQLGTPSVLLVFPDTMVVIERVGTLPARGILAEVDRASSAPSLMDAKQDSAPAQPPFIFRLAISLAFTTLTESYGSRLLNIAYSRALREQRTSNGPSQGHATLVLQLLGAYESKAYRLCEEVAMARIEHRWPEEIREDEKWALKSVQSPSDELGLVCAVSSVDCLTEIAVAKLPLGRTRVVMDKCLDMLPSRIATSLSAGVDSVINVNLLAEDRYSVEVVTRGQRLSVDTVSQEEFLTCITKRVGYLQRWLYKPADEETAQQHIVHARDLAKALEPYLNVDDQFSPDLLPAQQDSQRHRPLSPVKGLASLFGGSVREGATSPTKMFGRRGRADMAKSAVAPPVMAPQQHTGRPMSYYDPSKVQGTLESHLQRTTTTDPSKQAVDTFNSFIVAIQTRRGNIVGSSLQNRRHADEAEVNELYNILVQDPSQHQSTAEVSVDVLFAAFEKFLKNAWTSRLGPILPPPTVESIQNILFSREPGETQKFKVLLSEMRPENKAAFTKMISVLSELVSATGNDGDRGVLVLTFSEILIGEGNSQDHIALLDRLLANGDMLLGIRPPDATPEQPGPDRAKETGTGSIESAASSIRGKLGWPAFLTRGNSKSGEGETKGSLFRGGSKRSNPEAESTPPSLSRSVLSRTRSVDTRPNTPGSPSQSRPGSSYSGQGQDTSRPGSAHGLISSLAPIDETKTSRPRHQQLRPKRRSSLSDLPSGRLGGIPHVNPASPPPRNVQNNSIVTPPDPRSPATVVRSPQKTSGSVLSRPRPQSAYLKENTPPMLYERNLNHQDHRANAEPGRHRAAKSPTPSGIPVARSDVPQPLKMPQLSPTKHAQPTSPQKLRVQSPKKLRERLDQGKQNMTQVGGNLQSQLDEIGQQLSGLNMNSSTTPRELINRVAQFGETLKTELDALGARTDALQRDYESSLIVSEKKVKNLDQLYIEANGENELMYDRFNENLKKCMSGVKGEGMEEMKRQLKEAQDEAARVRKENQRLKRQNLGLQSQLRG